jgi:hypothetical protein
MSLQNVKAERRAPAASYSVGIVGSSLRLQSGRGVKLTAYSYLVPNLRICGAMPPLPILLLDVVIKADKLFVCKNTPLLIVALY